MPTASIRADMKPPSSERNTLLLVVTLVLVTTALFGIDFGLAGVERAESASSAARYYDEGRRSLSAGRAAEAIQDFQRAHALARDNRAYDVGLIEALIAARRYADAGTALNTLLGSDPNDGEANLLMARVMVANNDIAQAKAYYHRAIYGAWAGDSSARRLQVRMELVDLLAAHLDQKELLAELLPIQDETRSDAALSKRIAHLFLVAGSPGRAADAYKALIRTHPHTSDLYAGLGDAELETGSYQAAQAAFLNAFRRNPNDPAIRRRMELASAAANLDPTPRRLTSADKYRRSQRILQLASESLARCSAQAPAPPPSEKPALHATNEDAENVLSEAARIWQQRQNACGAAVPPEEEAVRLVMEKLRQ